MHKDSSPGNRLQAGFVNFVLSMHPKHILIADYTYSLPTEKIATHPLQQRDASKLLIYKDGEIRQDIYQHITAYLPEESLVVLNNTKVIPARILFKKPTGGQIEIFCLEPFGDEPDYVSAMQRKISCRWKCLIGGAGKWKGGILQKGIEINEKEKVVVSVQLIKKMADAYVAEISWTPTDYSFAEIIQIAGETPLPPYIKRKAEQRDKERYQTIYAEYEGSVAAPTAGLHFTETIFSSFKTKNIYADYITLHVGAGTFKPVKSEKMEGHDMHSEWIDVSLASVENIIQHLKNGIITIGTTSLRTLESLYWLGVKTIMNRDIQPGELKINQWEVYEKPLDGTNFSSSESLMSLKEWMIKNNLKRLITQTQILIAPGYSFKIAGAVVTNFHQPNSTLLLLVAAAVGKDWKKIYSYAFENDFRFLSYGDGSLLFIH